MLISILKFQSFGFWTLSDYPLFVLQYGFGVAHSYASNGYLSSEFQIYVFRFEFAKPQLFRMYLVLGFVRLTFKWCPLWFLDSLRFSFISAQIQIWNENHRLKKLKSDAFAYWQCPNWTLSVQFWVRFFLSVECDWKSKVSHNVQNLIFFEKRVFPKLEWSPSM